MEWEATYDSTEGPVRVGRVRTYPGLALPIAHGALEEVREVVRFGRARGEFRDAVLGKRALHQCRDIFEAVADGGQAIGHSSAPHQGDDRLRQRLTGVLRLGP